MKTYRVYAKSIQGQVAFTPVDKDGDALGVGDDYEQDEILLAYRVAEFDENGKHIGTRDYDAYGKNPEEVLAKIEKSHPANKWTLADR